MSEHFTWFVGIDWGQAEHRVCLVDHEGTVRREWTIAHTAGAVQDVWQQVRTLTAAASATAIGVGLETPHGVLVETLIDLGATVFAVNPKQLDRFRDRFAASAAKDDRRDARVLAESLRTDRRAFRPVQLAAPQILALRELTRLVEDLHVEEGRLTNRLREQLGRVDAAWLAVVPAADEPWLWTLLAASPHPDAWPQLTRRRLDAALRAHRIRRLTADLLVTRLRAPRLTAAPGVADAVAIRVAALVPQLQLISAQRRQSERQIDQVLATLAAAETPDREPQEHRDVEILRSLPGVGRMVTATMLAEAAGLLATRDYFTLRTYAGTAPVTKRSGKRCHVQMRYACKSRLRQALYHWARTSVQHDAPTRTYYDALRARGHAHPRALRSVADRWLRILIAMLTTRTLYDVTRLRATAA